MYFVRSAGAQVSQEGGNMSSISSVSGSPDYSAYSVLSNGGQLTKAAQGASDIAIQEKTESQVRGLDAGKENLTSAKSALNIEDGAMEGIADYLQSIKELAIRSRNGMLTDEDKESLQAQIDEYLEGINDIAGQTTYNEKSLLNGTNPDMSVTTDGSGSSEKVSTYDSTTKALGIEGLDVTKDDFDMSAIDKALETVSANRSNAGAETNGVDYALTYNSHAAMELNGFQMDREESNSVEAYQKMKTQQVLDTYQNMLQSQMQKDEAQKAYAVFT